jgi:predicted glycogen debranching enzyme
VNFPLVVDFGSEVCGFLESASEREWLVTNGLGGFACGTVAGVLTRRYHGLLIAALPPHSSRIMLVSKFDETLAYDGHNYELGANCWAGGTVAPKGFRWIQRFHLDGTTPVWTFACADALLEKRIWMQDGANTTFVRYELLRSSGGSADLEIKALVNHRDFHAVTHAGDWRMQVTPVNHGLRVTPREGESPFYLLSWSAGAEPQHEWYRDFELSEERARGLDDREDHLFAGMLRARLTPGQSVTIVLSTDPAAPLDGDRAASSQRTLEEKLVEQWVAAAPQASLDAPPWIRQLVLAAAQFPVRRPLPVVPDAHALIAGYPWFGEWGRDTMIALPGLTLETGRRELARLILQSSARCIDQGMLPNVFPEGGEEPGYNTVDAALWFVEAVRQYRGATSDLGLVGELFDVLAAIIDWYAHGTRYSIRADESDGLLHAGEPGVQLTWMDAKVGDQVITPRTGKPVEVNALWYNALRTMARFAFELNKSPQDYIHLAERVEKSFSRFWNTEAGCCYDVLDGPHGHDPSIRPNQIFAVSLPESPLAPEERKAVVDICARRLVTPRGLRTLDTADSRYVGCYGGPPATRDAAYHQGTVWAWLLGPFVLAHLRVYGNPRAAFSFLDPMAQHVAACGPGSVSEIFDGDAPYHPRGAIAQAWSVAEVLRAWRACYDAGLAAQSFPANPGR